jgi:hypothetical protein
MTLVFISNIFCNNIFADWTWLQQMDCNEIVRTMNRGKKILLFEKDKTEHFTQLVFSWNIMRPEEGYFSFYVQVRDAASRRWGTWHHMADWGADVQKTYLSKSDGVSSFVHVRLEMNDKKVADAFRIKIVPHKKASLSLVHSIAVALSDFNSFKPENLVNSELQSIHIKGLPTIAQFALEHEDNSRICSPVSCTMLVQYLTGNYRDPLEFAAKSFDAGLGVYGSWPCNTAHAFEECNGSMHFMVRRMNSFADLHEQLMKGMPVVVSVRGNLPGALKSFPHGHLLVVVGWDNETRHVLCHDPAAESNEHVCKRYPMVDFLRAWECSHRLSYIAESVELINIKNASF